MIDSFTHVYWLATVAVLITVGAVVGWILFYRVPDTSADLTGLLLFTGTAAAALHVGGKLVASAFPDHDVVEVVIEGSVSHDDSDSPVPSRGGGAPIDNIAEQADVVADSDNVDTLLVKLNASSDEVLPSDDICRTVADLGGPTIAYTTDTCTSNGYWTAGGCDELWPHDMNVVGSIDVIGSSVNASELADKVGLPCERFAAGKHKDVGMVLKKSIEDEHGYPQGFADDYYDDFVEHVAEDRDIDPQVVHDTKARVYFDEETHELGLVDSLGSRGDVENRLVECLGHDEVSMREFIPGVGLINRFHGDVGGAVYALGARLVSSVDPDDGFSFRL